MLARGTLAINQLADRAGRHRRVAFGFALLAPPVCLMGVTLAITEGLSIFALCHVLVALSFLWLTFDLTHGASLVDRRGVPHPSLGALIATMAVLRLSSPVWFTMKLGAIAPLLFSLISLAMALLFLMLADRRPNPALAFSGRIFLIVGGVVLGATQLIRMVNGMAEHPYYAFGLGIVGLLLLGMAAFEGRLLWMALRFLTHGQHR